MRALVAYHTLYGNTERIARALGAGLGTAGIETVMAKVDDVVVGSLERYDLVCIGGPTHYRTASEAMQSFLDSLAGASLSGKAAMAFDTRRDAPLAGGAAGHIESVLRKCGMLIVRRAQSGIMLEPELSRKKEDFIDKAEWKEWRHKNERLQEGEEVEFELTGFQVGRKLMGCSFPPWGTNMPIPVLSQGAD